MDTWSFCDTPFGSVSISKTPDKWIISTERTDNQLLCFYKDGKITSRIVTLDGQSYSSTPSKMSRWLSSRGVDFNIKEFETRAIEKIKNIIDNIERATRLEAERNERAERLAAFHNELKALMEKHNIKCTSLYIENCGGDLEEAELTDIFYVA